MYSWRVISSTKFNVHGFMFIFSFGHLTQWCIPQHFLLPPVQDPTISTACRYYLSIPTFHLLRPWLQKKRNRMFLLWVFLMFPCDEIPAGILHEGLLWPSQSHPSEYSQCPSALAGTSMGILAISLALLEVPPLHSHFWGKAPVLQ